MRNIVAKPRQTAILFDEHFVSIKEIVILAQFIASVDSANFKLKSSQFTFFCMFVS